MKKKLVLGLVLSLFFTLGLTNTLQAEEETFDEVASEVYGHGYFNQSVKVSDGYIASAMLDGKPLIMKLDVEGKEVWRYHDTDSGIPYVLIATSDGGALLSIGQQRMIKVNSNGKLEWKQDIDTLLGNQNYAMMHIEETSDGYILDIHCTHGSSSIPDYKASLVKFSKDGQTLLWQKEVGNGGAFGIHNVHSIDVLPTGNILLRGVLLSEPRSNDIIIVDNNGNELKRFTLSYDFVEAVHVLDDKIMIVGNTSDSRNSIITFVDFNGTILSEDIGGAPFSDFKLIGETDDVYQVLAERPYNNYRYLEISKTTLEEVREVIIPRPEGAHTFKVWTMEILDNGNFLGLGLIDNSPFIKEYGFILSEPPVEPTQPIDPDKPGDSTIGGTDTQQGSSQGSKTQAPATGDSTNLMLYAGLALVSLTAIVRYRKEMN